MTKVININKAKIDMANEYWQAEREERISDKTTAFSNEDNGTIRYFVENAVTAIQSGKKYVRLEKEVYPIRDRVCDKIEHMLEKYEYEVTISMAMGDVANDTALVIVVSIADYDCSWNPEDVLELKVNQTYKEYIKEMSRG